MEKMAVKTDKCTFDMSIKTKYSLPVTVYSPSNNPSNSSLHPFSDQTTNKECRSSNVGTDHTVLSTDCYSSS